IIAALGIAAALVIPLTQWGIASSVRFLIGYTKENVADPDTTLAVYMGSQISVLDGNTKYHVFLP
ncbi:Tetrapyrrole methylase, subdomain, partial [Trema orientale]